MSKKIGELEERLKNLTAQSHNVRAELRERRAAVREKERRAETRKNAIMGAAIQKAMPGNAVLSNAVAVAMKKYVTRESEKREFPEYFVVDEGRAGVDAQGAGVVGGDADGADAQGAGVSGGPDGASSAGVSSQRDGVDAQRG